MHASILQQCFHLFAVIFGPVVWVQEPALLPLTVEGDRECYLGQLLSGGLAMPFTLLLTSVMPWHGLLSRVGIVFRSSLMWTVQNCTLRMSTLASFWLRTQTNWVLWCVFIDEVMNVILVTQQTRNHFWTSWHVSYWFIIGKYCSTSMCIHVNTRVLPVVTSFERVVLGQNWYGFNGMCRHVKNSWFHSNHVSTHQICLQNPVTYRTETR